MPDRPLTSSRSNAKPSRNSPCRVRKRSNNCVSEKRLARGSGQALRSPDTGAYGGLGGQCKTQLAAERPLCTHAPIIIFFFSGRSWDHINIRTPHNAQFLSTYRSVRLHNSFTCMGNRIDYLSSGSSMDPHRFLYE